MQKKILALTALASACGAAMAQTSTSTLELYGLVDAGLNYVSGTQGASTRLVSGIMDGSRLGVRGNEDMGGGWRALFVLENRLEVNNGTVGNRPQSGSQLPDRLSAAASLGLPGALQTAVSGVASTIGSQVGVNLRNGFWDRQAYVGLVTPVGGILAGRQYTPAYEVFATFDATKTQSSLSAGQVSAFPPTIDIRVDNALAYRIQLDGLSAAAMMTFDGASPSNANRLKAINAIYKAGGWSVGAGYNTRNNELGESSLKSAVFGATLAAGPGTLSGMVGSVKDDHPTGLSAIPTALIAGGATAGQAAVVQGAFATALKQDSRVYNLGYTLTVGQLTSTVAVSKYDDRTTFDADTTSFGVAWTYALSKRTDVNLVLTRFNNNPLAQAAPGGAGFLGGFTKTAGTDSNNVAVGLRHRF
ncbi:porin [Leptothrix discophora]|uniref:Porin n=1 Tax=Leptothrix discophora TaxID=89 RepID=A0ABT9G609_LEPDI|nr:porin [Leptothrix discophora]MDP4301925.1 porin [Leptothrix discophora]